MEIFGNLIKGEVITEDLPIGTFPNMEKVIQNPRILFTSVLKAQGSFKRLVAQRLTGFLPERNPEKRLFLHEEIYEDFIAALIAKTEKLRPGLPSDSKTDLPVIGTRALYQIIDMISEALRKGAKLETGGYWINYAGERDEAGLFYKPTVLTDVDLTSSCWYQETFGPLLPIMKIRTFEEAINQANNTPYGLRTSVYSEDPSIVNRFFDEIQAPGVVINTDHLHFDDFYPHLGGLKMSGIFGGKYFYEILTYLKYRHFPSS